MKICHVTSVHPRYDIRIFEKECVSLAKSGYDTYLVVNDEKSDEIIKGVSIKSTGFKPGNRFERFIKSSAKVLKTALEVDAEIYHLHDPELLSIAKKIKRLGKVVIFDAHEDTELQIQDKQWIPRIARGFVAKLYSGYFRRVVRKLDGIVSVTPAFVEKFKAYNSNSVLVTNYPILDDESVSVRRASENESDDYVFFAGNISRQWNHELIAKAADICGIRYRFAGKGDSDYISEICRIPSAEYMGTIPHEEVRCMYSGAVAGMALLTCAQVGEEGTLGNTKLFEIMQAGKPVICTNFRLWKEIVDKYNCGLTIEAGNIDELVDAIDRLKKDKQLARELGENGHKAVIDVYNWKTQETVLLRFYDGFSKSIGESRENNIWKRK